MKWHLLAYGVVLALGAFVLDWVQFKFLTRTYPVEILTVFVAVLFLGLGIWAGGRLSSRRSPASVPDDPDRHLSFGITRREYDVLTLLAAGQSNKEMARELGVSPNTIKSHLAHLFEKLKVERRTQAVARARALDLIA